ncbi:hypothetical protein HHL11_16425 [Ramlibacter sp. G-1-2-2]|uniref:STAS domain-containing protein n=1 Tax=Ramlibacter agri TaxID=2728837 RepID=A0A848H767_9BURK|nr:hypothetical protein [Ramlibacter agri]NML45341.1 hypothetical protein [Ramlibacter agri]
MSFDISVTREAQQSRVTIKGDASLGQLLSLLQLLQVESRQWPRDELMLDLSGLEHRFGPSEQSRLQSEAARLLPWIPRITVRWWPA